MSIAISDALQQAEQAIQSGDLRSAIQTCNQLVKQFPDYAAAYRVLGEAYLGQGQTAEAEQAFAQALMRDPRQPLAYHGLGLIAEGQNVLENALAFCQVAWELAPNQPQLREPVIRIATQRFGSDGQAQLTSAALAQIYANTFRLQRAATEYRTALTDLPDRVDLKLGLTETLWQLGKDDEAADLCRQVLEENPVAVQALIVLADIESRSGNETEAADLRNRIRAIDPDGRTTALMLAHNSHANRDALLLSDDAIPVLDETAEAVVAERPHIAPAPDFSYQPARAEQPVQDIEDLEPISAEEFGGEAEAYVEDAEYDDDFTTQVTSELVTVEDTAEAGLSPEDDAPSIYRADEDALQAEPPQENIEIEQPVSAADVTAAPAEASLEADEPVEDDFDALMAEFGDVEPMGLDEFGAEPEDLERLAAAEQDLLEDDDLFAGFDIPPATGGGENEHVKGLASALEGEVAGVLDRTGEFQTVSPEAESEPEPVAEAEEAESPQETDAFSGTGYTTVLRELGDEGFTPFDPMGRPDVQEAPGQEQFASGEAGAGATGAEDENELLKLTQDWEEIDDEIARAVPQTTGQTDQLRAADDLGIAPFDFEIEDDTSRLPEYRPFGEEDDELPEAELDLKETGDILADESEAAHEESDTELEESAAVLEQEETVEAEAAPEVDADSDLERGVVPPPEDDLFANLEPFSVEEFEEDATSSQQFSFGALPWETQTGGSAVPSDEDLEQLLTSEERAEPQPEEPAPEPETGEPAVAPDWPTRVLDTAPEQPQEPVDWTTAIQDTKPQETEPEPDTSSWNIPEDWDSSLAVTRQIGDAEDDFSERPAAAEAAAQAGDEAGEEAIADEDLPQSTLLGGADPEKLAADEDLFERTRSAKTDLMDQGVIGGDQEFEADTQAEEPEPEYAPEPEPEPQVEEPVYEAPVDDQEFTVATGSSRDVNTLRASLEAAPEDDELHWWLAEALRERGDITDAYAEYRWIIRHAGHRSDDVIEALNACIENEQYAEVGHRLLADIYRRRGQVSLASSHAATAMAVRRRLRG